MTAAKTGIGSTLKLGDGASPEVFTTIAEIRTIDGPGLGLEFVDATNLTSANNFREVLPTFKDGGEVTFEANWLPNNATHDGTTGIYGEWDNRTLSNYQLGFAGHSPAQRLAFAGYVTGISNNVPFDDIQTVNVTIKIDGAVVLEADV